MGKGDLALNAGIVHGSSKSSRNVNPCQEELCGFLSRSYLEAPRPSVASAQRGGRKVWKETASAPPEAVGRKTEVVSRWRWECVQYEG